jgi:hypothetical protein
VPVTAKRDQLDGTAEAWGVEYEAGRQSLPPLGSDGRRPPSPSCLLREASSAAAGDASAERSQIRAGPRRAGLLVRRAGGMAPAPLSGFGTRRKVRALVSPLRSSARAATARPAGRNPTSQRQQRPGRELNPGVALADGAALEGRGDRSSSKRALDSRLQTMHVCRTYLSGPGRIRTSDLGIKSPLLYQLSYRPVSWVY